MKRLTCCMLFEMCGNYNFLITIPPSEIIDNCTENQKGRYMISCSTLFASKFSNKKKSWFYCFVWYTFNIANVRRGHLPYIYGFRSTPDYIIVINISVRKRIVVFYADFRVKQNVKNLNPLAPSKIKKSLSTCL